MKIRALFCAAAAGLLLLSGCASATTITEKEGNYVYSEGEAINIAGGRAADGAGAICPG